MIKKILKSGLVALTSVGLMASSASALQIEVIDVTTDTNFTNAAVAAWKAGFSGSSRILENFDDETPGWYDTYATTIDGTSETFGTFYAEGSAGTGDAAANGDDPLFQISSKKYPDNYGRGDLTGDPTGNYLESGDITSLRLDLEDNTYTNLFFYLMDPSDQGGITTISAAGETKTPFNDNLFLSKKPSSVFFVGLTVDPGEMLKSIWWDVDTTRDGYGIESFGTVVVPEPATMLLFGAGLAGLAGIARRRKEG